MRSHLRTIVVLALAAGLLALFLHNVDLWRVAGDMATDFNHYSKRAILLGVYGATSLVFLDDDSADYAQTRLFLDRRIDEVMRFEKWKADLGAWRAPKRWAARR